jgi:hypothetical protein
MARGRACRSYTVQPARRSPARRGSSSSGCRVRLWQQPKAACPQAPACCRPCPQGADPAKQPPEAFRAMLGGFSADPAMAKALGKLASGMAADLGMAPKRADLQAALYPAGVSALYALVSAAMKAWLQVHGSGRGLRITVVGGGADASSGGCAALVLRRWALRHGLPSSRAFQRGCISRDYIFS